MTTTLSRRGLSALALAAVATLAYPSRAEEAWPAKAVKLVVPFPPGGGTDLVARAMGQKLAERLKQPVVIDNKPGASTIIGTDAVAKAAPDGYTLLLSGSTSYSVNPALRGKLPYDRCTTWHPSRSWPARRWCWWSTAARRGTRWPN